jgi:hypothetical protein
MNKSKIGFGLLIAAVLLVGMVGVGWGVPNLINVQGRLVDKATGLPVASQTLDVTVNYYNAETGGTLIAAISGNAYSPRTDSNGVFNLTLGEGLPETLKPDFTSEDYYVEFVVGATIGGTWRMETIPDPTLPSPANKRQRLVSVPFAITAKNVRGGTVVAGNSAGNGVYGEVTSDTLDSGWSAGVYGRGRAGTHGVMGYTASATRNAVMGWNDGSGSGVYGFGRAGIGVQGYIPNKKANGTTDNDNTNPAVYGYNLSPATGDNPGVKGESVKGYGVYGFIPQYSSGTTANTNTNPAIYGYNLSPASGAGVMGKGQPGVKGEYSGDANVLGQLGSTKSFSVYYNDDGTTVVGGTDLLRKAGTLGQMSSSTFGTLGVKLSGTGVPADEHGVYGETDSNTAAIKGFNVKSTIVGTDQNPGVEGRSRAGVGVFGKSLGVKPGVYGESTQRIGVSGKGLTAGVYGVATATGYFGGVFENANGGGVSGTSNTTLYSGVSAVNRGTDNIEGNADDGAAIYINSIIQLVPRATPPTTRAVRGMVYYDSGSDEIKVYNGYSWRSLQYKP